jgi:hypothetical protein
MRPMQYNIPRLKMKQTPRFPTPAPDPGEHGWLLFIRDQLQQDAPVFIGWCPSKDHGAASDLLDRVQFGSPLPLVIVGMFPVSRAIGYSHVKALKAARTTTDNASWYRQTPQVLAWLGELRRAQAEQQAALVEAV